jgi:hypothetical protein
MIIDFMDLQASHINPLSKLLLQNKSALKTAYLADIYSLVEHPQANSTFRKKFTIANL